MKLTKRISFIVLSFVVLFSSCMQAPKQQSKETALIASEKVKASSSEKPLVVRLGVNDTYGLKTACACIGDLACREYDELQKVLKEKYNIDLQLTYFMEEYELVDALSAGEFDGALCKPWFAYMLVPQNGVTYKRVADLLDPSNNPWLTGIFIVKKDTPIRKLEDIQGKRLVLGQADSYEKYHAPLAMLQEKEIQPVQMINKASCLECIGELLDDNADVAIISDYALTASCAVDIAAPEDFDIIGRTTQIPLCSVILDMAKVNEKDALRLQQALLAVSGADAPKGLISKGFVAPAKWEPEPLKQ